MIQLFIPGCYKILTMLRSIDTYFLKQEKPIRGSLHFLREYILKVNKNISEKSQYGVPFFYFNNKRICYLWVHKKLQQPYLGIVDGKKINHPDLLTEKRIRMEILLIDAGKNIPVGKIKSILKKAILICN